MSAQATALTKPCGCRYCPGRLSEPANMLSPTVSVAWRILAPNPGGASLAIGESAQVSIVIILPPRHCS